MKSLLFLLTTFAIISLACCQNEKKLGPGGTEGFSDKNKVEEDDLKLPNLGSFEDIEKIVDEKGLHALTQMVRGGIDLQLLQISFLASKAQKDKKLGKSSDSEIAALYMDVSDLVVALTESIQDPKNAKKFFEKKGLEQVVYNNFASYPNYLKSKILELLKVLYEWAPETLIEDLHPDFTEVLIDSLLDTSTNIATRGLISDVLNFWLPKNPAVQATFLERRGMETFYKAIKHMEEEKLYKYINLFLTLYREHVQAEKQKAQYPKKYKIYARVNFFKYLSTKDTCLGFIFIMDKMFAYSLSGNKMLIPIVQIVSTLKPYCADIINENPDAVKFIKGLQDYIAEKDNNMFFDKMGVNSAELKKTLNDYFTPPKTEL